MTTKELSAAGLSRREAVLAQKEGVSDAKQVTAIKNARDQAGRKRAGFNGYGRYGESR